MVDPSHKFAELLGRDDRYHADAYVFVFDALRYGLEEMGLGAQVDLEESADEEEEDDGEAERHVSGQDLCRAIQQYAIEQYGMLARSVLRHWRIEKTGDFGDIVFNLIETGQMRKTDEDRREDFDDVFDFEEAFGEEQVFSAEHCSTDGGAGEAGEDDA
ncbi:MAG: Minf_1886 family protein [Lacipirellulaceae bacterium]